MVALRLVVAIVLGNRIAKKVNNSRQGRRPTSNTCITTKDVAVFAQS